VSLERDARWFLETLYRGQPTPSVIALSWKTASGRLGQSRFPRTPDDALPLIIGGVDVYHRITLLAGKPPGRQRGDETAAIALPGVWFDADINGAPDGNGDVVKNAFPSLAAAQEIATAVLEPTMLVCSGYGLQGYYLFEQMLTLSSEEERARAKALVQGFEARLRQEAHDRFGVRKLDSVFDLARVLRPVGSANGKGSDPRPVELVDDGGARYTVNAIAAEMINTKEAPEPPAGGDGTKATVEEVLGRDDDLAKIVARKGTKPGDGSASAWDFMLGCRAAEHGYKDDLLAALIRHSRHKHGEGKGGREDYVERTIAAVRRRVGYISADSTRDEVLSEITTVLRLGDVRRRAIATRVAGHGNSASAAIVLDNGYAIEFDQFAHVAQPDKLADQLATTVAITTQFSKLQARRVASLVRMAASRIAELHERDIYIEEAMKMLRLAELVKFKFADQASKWEVWQQLEATDPEETPEGPPQETSAQRHNRERNDAEAYAKRMLVPCDVETGVRFVHAGWFQHFMRLRLGPSSTPQKARQAMLGAGWQVRGQRGRIKATDPNTSAVLELFFYLVAKNWESRNG
jgi:hypothetical protein